LCNKAETLTDNQIDYEPLTQAEDLGLLNRIPEYLRYKSIHLISPTGDIQSGSEALPSLINLFPLGHHISKLIVLAPTGKRMMTFIYSTFCYIYAIRNRIMASVAAIIAEVHTILFQSMIFCPSRTPNGKRLNIAIHALNDAPAYKYK
jgi:hypothetical protein